MDTPGSGARQRAWLVVPIVGAALLALFYALPVGAVTQSAVYDALGLTMAAAAILGIRLHRPAGWQAWLLIAIGQLLFVVGDLIWTTYAAIGEDPFPSPADVAYLAGYPLIAIGLALAIRGRVRGGDRAGVLDGAILATGAVVVWWSLILGPLVDAMDPDPLIFAISIAYPIADLLLLGMALGLLMGPGARSPSFFLLVANLVVLLIGDLVFNLQSVDGTYVDGGLLDGVWLVGYVLFAMAALHPSMATLFEPRPIAVALLGPVRLLLLGAAMLIGPALLSLDQGAANSFVVVVAAATAGVSILVLVRLSGMVGHLARDIERRSVLEAQLSFQAFHDPLTGLANRRMFIDAVAAAIEAKAGTAVLFLDLDDFKHVNDAMGHDAGDALLTAVGNRILGAIRPDDLGCRIGGDEFAVLLPATPVLAEAEAVGRRLLAAIGAPVSIESRDLVVPASIGVALNPPGVQVAVDELLRQADVAMYHAKAAGKHRLAAYEPALDAAPAPGSGPSSAPAPHARRPPVGSPEAAPAT